MKVFLCHIGTLNFIMNAMKIYQSILKGITTQMHIYKMEDVEQGISVVSSIFTGSWSSNSKVLNQNGEYEGLEWPHRIYGRIAEKYWVWVRIGMVMELAGRQKEERGQVWGQGQHEFSFEHVKIWCSLQKSLMHDPSLQTFVHTRQKRPAESSQLSW